MVDNRRDAIILNVPYSEKNEAKQLGAFWNPEIKKWCVPLGADIAPFARWISGEAKVRNSEKLR